MAATNAQRQHQQQGGHQLFEDADHLIGIAHAEEPEQACESDEK